VGLADSVVLGGGWVDSGTVEVGVCGDAVGSPVGSAQPYKAVRTTTTDTK